jgi:hypothetical protein
MENQRKIEELLADSLKKQDQFIEQQKETNNRLDQTNSRLDTIDQSLYRIEGKTDKVEEQLVKLNLQTNENSRAILKLADAVEA